MSALPYRSDKKDSDDISFSDVESIEYDCDPEDHKTPGLPPSAASPQPAIRTAPTAIPSYDYRFAPRSRPAPEKDAYAATAAHMHTLPAPHAPIPAHRLGAPVAYDADGRAPVYLGTAHGFARDGGSGGGAHPCKVVPALGGASVARVPFGGGEHAHAGRVDVLRVDEARMEWVPAARGAVPVGRRPVVGGRERDGRLLYFALAPVGRVWVPGKVGTHLPGAHVPFGGKEHIVVDGYDILCWRD
ncbi:hypothetical protein C8Q77DRAFT_1073743 [Trametes polyzona]|nr:hypothetical protein C8Q77DRAFT_1073743 [Trametes polyzona]